MKLKTALVVSGILVVVIGLILMRSMNQKNIQMNNQKCPVSGKSVNKGHTYVHNGKEYNLCSEECKQPLSEHPEKYLSD